MAFFKNKLFIITVFIFCKNTLFAETESYKTVLFTEYSTVSMAHSDNLKLSTSVANNLGLGVGVFTKVFDRNILLYSKAGVGTGAGSNQVDSLKRTYAFIGFDYYDNPLTKAIYRHNLLSRKHKFLVGAAIGYNGIFNKYSNTNPENAAIFDQLYFNQVRINGGGLVAEVNLGYDYAFYKNHNISLKISTQATIYNTFDVNSVISNEGIIYDRYYSNQDSFISSMSFVVSYKYFIQTSL